MVSLLTLTKRGISFSASRVLDYCIANGLNDRELGSPCGTKSSLLVKKERGTAWEPGPVFGCLGFEKQQTVT